MGPLSACDYGLRVSWKIDKVLEKSWIFSTVYLYEPLVCVAGRGREPSHGAGVGLSRPRLQLPRSWVLQGD